MSLRTVLTISILLSLSLFAIAENAQAAEKKLIVFSMEDQFSKKFTNKDLEGKIILMVASDKTGSMYSEKWALAINKNLEEIQKGKPVKVVANLQLSDVPEFMRGAMKRLMPRDKETRVLLDWKAGFTKPYALKKGKCNILVFNEAGDLIHQSAVTKLKSSDAGKIAALIAKEQQNN